MPHPATTAPRSEGVVPHPVRPRDPEAAAMGTDALTSSPRTATSRSRIGRTLRRVAITLAGLAVVVAGIAMLVLPGPGLVTIALGVSLLGREHAWAAALDQRLRARVAAAARRVRPPAVTTLPVAAVPTAGAPSTRDQERDEAA